MKMRTVMELDPYEDLAEGVTKRDITGKYHEPSMDDFTDEVRQNWDKADKVVLRMGTLATWTIKSDKPTEIAPGYENFGKE